MFAGFGTPVDTNRRFKEILAAGGDGLSTAFDLPTLMGRDSDDPLALGEVGKCGVAVDTLADVEDLYRDIDLGSVTTSMTINSPAPVLLAMYLAAAESTGVAAGPARRDAAERHPEGVPGPEGVLLPAATERAAGERRDRVHRGRDAALAPGLDLRLPHPRSRIDRPAGARVHGRQRVRLRRGRGRGRARDRRLRTRASPSSSTRTSTSSRRSRSTGPRGASGPGGCATATARYERAVAADALPHPDRGGVAHRAAARGQPRPHRDRGARGRARRLAEPPHELVRRSARPPDREGGATRAPHPAGDRARDRVSRTSPTRSAAPATSRRSPTRWSAGPRRSSPTSRSSAAGRCSRARSSASSRAGTSARSSEAAYELERKLNDGRHVMVGVNEFLEGNDDAPPETAPHQPGLRGGAVEAARGGQGRSRHRRGRAASSRGSGPTPPTRRQHDARLRRGGARLRHGRRDHGRDGRRVRPLPRSPRLLVDRPVTSASSIRERWARRSAPRSSRRARGRLGVAGRSDATSRSGRRRRAGRRGQSCREARVAAPTWCARSARPRPRPTSPTRSSDRVLRGVYVDADAVLAGDGASRSATTRRGRRGHVRRRGDHRPAAAGRGTTRLYLSGPEASPIAELFAGTLARRPCRRRPLGSASALKMAYAAYTKGLAALLLALRETARA